MLFAKLPNICKEAPCGKVVNMSRVCEYCGKGPMSGNRVSKANNHTRRVWKPNLIKVKTEINGVTRTVKICTNCLKSGNVVKKVSVKKADRAPAT